MLKIFKKGLSGAKKKKGKKKEKKKKKGALENISLLLEAGVLPSWGGGGWAKAEARSICWETESRRAMTSIPSSDHLSKPELRSWCSAWNTKVQTPKIRKTNLKNSSLKTGKYCEVFKDRLGDRNVTFAAWAHGK